MTSATMTAGAVVDALERRWPAAEYLALREAPQDSMRQGRKLDLLVISLWNSRGHQLDGVEIKVSVSDWRRELKAPAKADWWVHHVHRFWIATPTDVAAKIKDEIPPGWGLLAVGDKVREVIKAKRRANPTTFTWAESIGLLRAAADAGPNMLRAAQDRGYTEGLALGKAAGVAEAARGNDPAVAAHELAQLRERCTEFKNLTGVDLTTSWGDIGADAAAFNLARKMGNRPDGLARHLTHVAEGLDARARAMRTLATDVTKLAEASIGPEVDA